MRERNLSDNQTEMPGTAIIRRERERRRLRVETADTLLFNAAAFRLDRELGIAEHVAVENNLRVVTRWPAIVYDMHRPALTDE